MSFKWANNSEMSLAAQIEHIHKAAIDIESAIAEIQIACHEENQYANEIIRKLRRIIRNDDNFGEPNLDAMLDSLSMSEDLMMDKASRIAEATDERWDKILRLGSAAAANEMRAVHIGDMVCEISTARRGTSDIERVGTLVKMESVEGGDTRYTLRLLNGEVKTWENAYFLKAVANV